MPKAWTQSMKVSATNKADILFLIASTPLVVHLTEFMKVCVAKKESVGDKVWDEDVQAAFAEVVERLKADPRPCLEGGRHRVRSAARDRREQGREQEQAHEQAPNWAQIERDMVLYLDRMKPAKIMSCCCRVCHAASDFVKMLASFFGLAAVLSLRAKLVELESGRAGPSWFTVALPLWMSLGLLTLRSLLRFPWLRLQGSAVVTVNATRYTSKRIQMRNQAEVEPFPPESDADYELLAEIRSSQQKKLWRRCSVGVNECLFSIWGVYLICSKLEEPASMPVERIFVAVWWGLGTGSLIMSFCFMLFNKAQIKRTLSGQRTELSDFAVAFVRALCYYSAVSAFAAFFFLLVCLKLSSSITAKWAINFIPYWIMIAILLALNATAILCLGVQQVLRYFGSPAEARRIAEQVKAVDYYQQAFATVGTILMCTFLAFLCEKLDGVADMTINTLFLPLITGICVGVCAELRAALKNYMKLPGAWLGCGGRQCCWLAQKYDPNWWFKARQGTQEESSNATHAPLDAHDEQKTAATSEIVAMPNSSATVI